jgi:predicted NUDIX family NTP pyrophosphohydrolase
MKRNAGLMMYRRKGGALEVFLVHPGGPYWVKEDEGWWTLPKREYEEPEETLEAARREFQEETGSLSQGPFLDLGWFVQASGKLLTAYACEGDCNAEKLISNACEIQWPPRSGRKLQIPEIDRGQWCGVDEAGRLIRPGQVAFLNLLVDAVGERRDA